MGAGEEKNLDQLLENLDTVERREFNRIFYGRAHNEELKLHDESIQAATALNIELKAYLFTAAREQTRPSRIVRVAVVQHSISVSTDKPVDEQRSAIHRKIKDLITIAADEGVNIICLQEAWTMPLKHKMVIVSPIIEKDEHDKIWNTAVVISDSGTVIGKHRKNHLPISGSSDETLYYAPGNTGHPVFETRYGRIAVNICYGRHHPQNWLMFGLNGAEIVFNPSATISSFGESFWGIEARNAAVANNYFTCSINRVGNEEFLCDSGKKTVIRSYYGSSYITAPDGVRTPGLSRNCEGILIADMDLNLCRQVKDIWGFNMTRRLDMYAEKLNKYVNVHCKNS